MKIKKLNENAILPKRADEGAAGYDLYACIPDMERIVIHPNTTVMIPTFIAMSIPRGYFGAIYPRSGLATKQGLRLANCVGVVDESFRGNIMVALHNDSTESRVVEHGERIAQMIFQPYSTFDFEEVETLDSTSRGEGGFGSSGRN